MEVEKTLVKCCIFVEVYAFLFSSILTQCGLKLRMKGSSVWIILALGLYIDSTRYWFTLLIQLLPFPYKSFTNAVQDWRWRTQMSTEKHSACFFSECLLVQLWHFFLYNTKSSILPEAMNKFLFTKVHQLLHTRYSETVSIALALKTKSGLPFI